MQNWIFLPKKVSLVIFGKYFHPKLKQSGAKYSSQWALCVTVSGRAQEMCSIRSGPYVAFWWRFVFLWIHRWRYTSLETLSLFACVYLCVWARERERKRESQRVRVYGRGSPQLWCLPGPGTGEGHPGQNRAYANVPQLWPSARQSGFLPGNKPLCLPIWDMAYRCQPCMTTSWIMYTSRSLGSTSAV